MFSVWVIIINCAGHNFLSWGRGNKRKKQGKSCGKDALAIGGATAADMAIVASAFNSDHPG
jgi:hypothetical protein